LVAKSAKKLAANKISPTATTPTTPNAERIAFACRRKKFISFRIQDTAFLAR
jgi:hypothetical protein